MISWHRDTKLEIRAPACTYGHIERPWPIIAGLLPVAVGIGAGSEQRASIAVTIIGGQTLCMLLTLLVVPVGYSYLAELKTTPWRQRATRALHGRVTLAPRTATERPLCRRS